MTVHSDDEQFALSVAEALHGAAFRAYTGNDMLGAELGGAMKTCWRSPPASPMAWNWASTPAPV